MTILFFITRMEIDVFWGCDNMLRGVRHRVHSIGWKLVIMISGLSALLIVIFYGSDSIAAELALTSYRKL